MSTEKEQPPTNVISFETRQPYEPPRPALEKGQVHTESVEILETFLEAVKKGEICGLCILGFDIENGMPAIAFAPPPGEDFLSASLRMAGGLEFLKARILEASSDYGTQEMIDDEGDE